MKSFGILRRGNRGEPAGLDIGDTRVGHGNDLALGVELGRESADRFLQEVRLVLDAPFSNLALDDPLSSSGSCTAPMPFSFREPR